MTQPHHSPMTTPLGEVLSENLGSKRARVFTLPKWQGEDGMRRILIMATPLILSNAVMSINMFMDRTFLAWYSQDSFGAALQGGIMFWAVMSLFHQVVGYSGTFVAHYFGAKQFDRIGATIWQGIYLAILGGIIMAMLAPLGYPLFRMIGHVGELPKLEADYFFILTVGGLPILINCALYSYFAGQGRTNLLLFVNFAICMINICLNAWMIFKPVWIFQEGISGAAWATVLSNVVGIFIYIGMILADPKHEVVYKMRSSIRMSGKLLWRMLSFGLPAGIHQTIDVLGFTVFLMVVGSFGYQAQIASNMAMNINMLLFIPAVGMHIAVGILAGQFAGSKNQGAVERVTAGATVLTLVYMLIVTVFYIFLPGPLLELFRGGQPESTWVPVYDLARFLLLFVAFYSVFDAVFLIYSGVLKGCGDTKFVMWMSLIFSQVFLTGPCIVLAMKADAFTDPNTGLYLAWGLCANYIITLAAVNLLRYWGGHWKDIDVIATEPKIED